MSDSVTNWRRFWYNTFVWSLLMLPGTVLWLVARDGVTWPDLVGFVAYAILCDRIAERIVPIWKQQRR